MKKSRSNPNYKQFAIAKKLDLDGFLSEFFSFFARDSAKNGEFFNKKPKPFNDFVLQNENAFAFINALESRHFTPPQKIANLDFALFKLKKAGILSLPQIFEFVKIINYFLYLKDIFLRDRSDLASQNARFCEYLNNIFIKDELLEICNIFDINGEIKSGLFPKLDGIKINLKNQNARIKSELDFLLSRRDLSDFLINKSVHLINNQSALLLKPGFNKVLKGRIIDRSRLGYCFVLPDSLRQIYDKIDELNELLQTELFEISKQICEVMHANLAFFNFINGEFDFIDNLQARIFFARSKNLVFCETSNTDELILKDFCHPILQNPKSLSVKFRSSVLIVSGVNAGGKTILLKSMLCACFLSKHLLPFKINASASKIPRFESIIAIIEDPQSSANNISTFAGRMLEFSTILNSKHKNSMLLGVDEIEIGTDFEQSASLYKEILLDLMNSGAKIIVTTHHKMLAKIMSEQDGVELLAALYDEQNERPTYEFLEGIIGASYAFETAMRYNIPKEIIEKATKNDKSKNLESLIKQTQALNQELKNELDRTKMQEINYQNELENLKESYNNRIKSLEESYSKALNLLKSDAKNLQNMHRNMNEAHNLIKNSPVHTPPQKKTHNMAFQIGSRISYKGNDGVILSLHENGIKIQLSSGFKVLAKEADLQKQKPQKAQKISSRPITKAPANPKMSINLQGLFVDEALLELEQFLSDCLLAGFSSAIIIHGIGSGSLKRAISQFLKAHKAVLSFEVAPLNLGGNGATIIKL
ncbi:MAG: Smr/MutS family protein [Helicobacter sp.]|nr:Smr/MutS family protein [Helicobacter sp.]